MNIFSRLILSLILTLSISSTTVDADIISETATSLSGEVVDIQLHSFKLLSNENDEIYNVDCQLFIPAGDCSHVRLGDSVIITGYFVVDPDYTNNIAAESVYKITPLPDEDL